MNDSNQESRSDDEPGLRETDDTLPMGLPTFSREEIAQFERQRSLKALDSRDIGPSRKERAEGTRVRSATSPSSPASGARRNGLGPSARQFRPMRLSFEDMSRKRDRSTPDDDSWH